MEKSAPFSPPPGVPIRQTGASPQPQRVGIGAALREAYVPSSVTEEFSRLLARIV